MLRLGWRHGHGYSCNGVCNVYSYVLVGSFCKYLINVIVDCHSASVVVWGMAHLSVFRWM